METTTKSAATVALLLQRIGALLELKGESPFRARAYENGAKAVFALGEEGLRTHLNALESQPGIGKSLAKLIVEIYQTGSSSLYRELLGDLPEEIFSFAQIPGIGLARASTLYRSLGIKTLEGLRAALTEGKVRAAKGFGEKTEQRLLEAIKAYEEKQSTPAQVLLSEALLYSTKLSSALHAAGLSGVSLVGEARRMEETVGKIELVGIGTSTQALSVFKDSGLSSIEATESHLQGSFPNGVSVKLWLTTPSEKALLQHQKNSAPSYQEALRELALQKSLRLEERGLFQKDTNAPIEVSTEEELYQKVGAPYLPPELRSGKEELEAALHGVLPGELIEASHLQGAIHCHTTYSDGKNTIEEMALAAQALGLSYITITDHSRSAGYAGGLSIDQLKAQAEEIARVQEKVSIKILHGTESDILADGSLDYPDEVLASLDVVIASIHNRYKHSEEVMTQRLIRAMRLPLFKIWGHALGRLLLERPPFACRVEEVLDAAAESKVAIEVNADPQRLDLAPRWIKAARERKIPFVISTDAHSVGGLQNAGFGVMMARRGWVQRQEVLNALPFEAFHKKVKPA